MQDQLPDLGIFNLGQLAVLWTVFAFAVLVHLTERENGRLEKELCDDTASAEDVHGPVDMSIPGIFSCDQEPFRGKIAGPPAGDVKIKGKVRRVVFGQECRFERGRKVREIEPVP